MTNELESEKLEVAAAGFETVSEVLRQSAGIVRQFAELFEEIDATPARTRCRERCQQAEVKIHDAQRAYMALAASLQSVADEGIAKH